MLICGLFIIEWLYIRIMTIIIVLWSPYTKMINVFTATNSHSLDSYCCYVNQVSFTIDQEPRSPATSLHASCEHQNNGSEYWGINCLALQLRVEINEMVKDWNQLLVYANGVNLLGANVNTYHKKTKIQGCFYKSRNKRR